MSGTVSQAYLLGIREGRSLLKTHERENGALSLDDAKAFLANAKTCLAMGFSGEMRDTIKGERDFWANQCKRLTK